MTKLEAVRKLRVLTNEMYNTMDAMKKVLAEVDPELIEISEDHWMACIDASLENRGNHKEVCQAHFEDIIDSLES